MRTDFKGNISETEIENALKRLQPDVASVNRIPNQEDPNHWDLFVTLREPLDLFFVQSKFLSTDNPRIKTKHIIDWLNASYATVPMWWDEARRTCYWADLLRFLLRSGGTITRRNATFNKAEDLRPLVPNDEQSSRSFLRWIRGRARLWRSLSQPESGSLLPDIEYPASLADALVDPDILPYLPVSRSLVSILDDYMGTGSGGRAHIARAVLRAVRKATGSPLDAASRLIREFNLPAGDREIVIPLRTYLTQWSDRIPSNRKFAVQQSLWAFDKLLSLLTYQKPGDVALPSFASKHTYPVGRLVNLLPWNAVADSLLQVLKRDNDPQVLLHVAWCFGILNHPVGSELWRPIREIRRTLRQRKATVGVMWPVVDRQLLYTEAQLGSAQAQEQFIRILSRSEGASFDAAYNYAYYDGDALLIHDRFERRLEEGIRTDLNTRTMLTLIYNHLRKQMRDDPQSLVSIRPELWPVD